MHRYVIDMKLDCCLQPSDLNYAVSAEVTAARQTRRETIVTCCACSSLGAASIAWLFFCFAPLLSLYLQRVVVSHVYGLMLSRAWFQDVAGGSPERCFHVQEDLARVYVCDVMAWGKRVIQAGGLRNATAGSPTNTD